MTLLGRSKAARTAVIAVIGVLGVLLSLTRAATQQLDSFRKWEVYGGTSENIHYSSLTQINRENISHLQEAWAFDAGDKFEGRDMECNPIVVGGRLFATTPRPRVIALDATTGHLIWDFDPYEGKTLPKLGLDDHHRGVTWWSSGEDERILFVANHFLYSLDARTGKPVRTFGQDGRVDLRLGLGRPPETVAITATSPGVVYQDLLIIGSTVAEALPAAPGDIRAFDVRTGLMKWSFHTIPHPGEFGANTWPKNAWMYSGGANAWGGLSLDEKRSLVFAATGSAASDFYGSNRVGSNLFADCILALNAKTGKLVWYFQGVSHDLWDRDFPAAPSLITVMHNGIRVDALAQVTKSGHIFVFNRENGHSLFPIEYKSVPTSDVPGERTARTQPLPLKPLPFARQIFDESMVTDRTPEAHQAVLLKLRQVQSRGQFVPPSLQGTVIFPGTDGGAEWGGGAYDPETGLFYINSNEMAWIYSLVKRTTGPTSTGKSLYLDNCAGCHRPDRGGNPPVFPSLRHLTDQLTLEEIEDTIRAGGGRMPAFAQFSDAAMDALVQYVVSGKEEGNFKSADASSTDLKYIAGDYRGGAGYKFLDPDGYPGIKPPWGTLNAIQLKTGDKTWSIPFGEYPELVAKGFRNTGSENYGGPVVTKGGLLFIGATDYDKKFHAFDKLTGKLLWETTLPASGNATPAVYEVNGREFVVIAAGGGKWGNPSGSTYIAYSLPTGDTK